jgi:hypothetical protein
MFMEEHPELAWHILKAENTMTDNVENNTNLVAIT